MSYKKPNRCDDINVVIGSVRAAHFIGPLDGAASSFYYLYKCLADKWDNKTVNVNNKCYRFHFGYFNAVPSDRKPRADIKDLQNADVILIVVENEYQYEAGKINPMYRQYLDERLEKIRETLHNKTVIILNSDIR